MTDKKVDRYKDRKLRSLTYSQSHVLSFTRKNETTYYCVQFKTCLLYTSQSCCILPKCLHQLALLSIILSCTLKIDVLIQQDLLLIGFYSRIFLGVLCCSILVVRPSFYKRNYISSVYQIIYFMILSYFPCAVVVLHWSRHSKQKVCKPRDYTCNLLTNSGIEASEDRKKEKVNGCV